MLLPGSHAAIGKFFSPILTQVLCVEVLVPRAPTTIEFTTGDFFSGPDVDKRGVSEITERSVIPATLFDVQRCRSGFFPLATSDDVSVGGMAFLQAKGNSFAFGDVTKCPGCRKMFVQCLNQPLVDGAHEGFRTEVFKFWFPSV